MKNTETINPQTNENVKYIIKRMKDNQRTQRMPLRFPIISSNPIKLISNEKAKKFTLRTNYYFAWSLIDMTWRVHNVASRSRYKVCIECYEKKIIKKKIEEDRKQSDVQA